MDEVKTYSRLTKTNKLIEFKYSKCDEEFINSHKWFYSTNGYVVTNIWKNKRANHKSLHRLLMGEPEDLWVDHKDGDKLNNTRTNLRLATPTQNNRNVKRTKNNTSGTTGVYWHTKYNHWVARITVKYKSIYLGGFTNKEDAIKAREAAEIEHFGEYRRLNNG